MFNVANSLMLQLFELILNHELIMFCGTSEILDLELCYYALYYVQEISIHMVINADLTLLCKG